MNNFDGFERLINMCGLMRNLVLDGWLFLVECQLYYGLKLRNRIDSNGFMANLLWWGISSHV